MYGKGERNLFNVVPNLAGVDDKFLLLGPTTTQKAIRDTRAPEASRRAPVEE
jgi:hypothetical protein